MMPSNIGGLLQSPILTLYRITSRSFHHTFTEFKITTVDEIKRQGVTQLPPFTTISGVQFFLTNVSNIFYSGYKLSRYLILYPVVEDKEIVSYLILGC